MRAVFETSCQGSLQRLLREGEAQAIANRVYVILADFEGKRFSAQKVTDSFAEVKET